MRIRNADLGDIRLEVAEAGDGGRPVLLVHGFTADKGEVSGVLDALAGRGWHAVAPDLRGHGRSDHPTEAGAYGFELLAADVLRLADQLEWDRFALVGHSMGGAVAQFVALDHPERLTGVLLANTFHGPVPGVTAELVELGSWVVRQSGMVGLAQALAARRADNPASIATFERLQEARPGHDEESTRRLEATSPEMWLALAPRFVDQPDRLDRLRSLGLVTSVVVGELDTTMFDDCRRIADAVPGATLTVIPDVGHLPQIENPDAWEAAVVGFLDRLVDQRAHTTAD